MNLYKKLDFILSNLKTINKNNLFVSRIQEKYLFKNKIRFQTTCFKTYQLQNDLFKKIITPELSSLTDLFKKYHFELRICGGAVRDLLMNIEPQDIDLATNAKPTEMLDIFEKENIRIFNINGIKHGTITVRIKDKVRI